MRIISTTTDWTPLLKRPVASEIPNSVSQIIEQVKREGDSALYALTKRFDGVELKELSLKSAQLEKLASDCTEELRSAVNLAIRNISNFHDKQRPVEFTTETLPGITCGRVAKPIERVGLYTPQGLVSSLIMLGIPAKLAGCSSITLCTPPNGAGTVTPAIAYTALTLGIPEIFLLGGAQAIAAMAFGTTSVPAVDKIFGPGNQFVNAAKLLISSTTAVAIDLPAGPTELLIIADDSADPRVIAADILSQAEHGADSQVVLVSSSLRFLEATVSEIKPQLDTLSRRGLAAQALATSFCLLTSNLYEAIFFANSYAPEHLLIATENPGELFAQVTNAGSVFLGLNTAPTLGDYASGTNHTLPTNGAARAYSGVTVESFRKWISFQEVTPTGLQGISDAVCKLALAEGLTAHAAAVQIRRNRYA